MEKTIVKMIEKLIVVVDRMTAMIDTFTARVKAGNVSNEPIRVPNESLIHQQVMLNKGQIAEILRKHDTRFSVKDLENMRKLG